ncbi:hypothetical protein AUK22_07080 [bacterium CG2_30_54_10]|nr:MAG: hypothetical protein AUK22_07080 [bacterium CG2_30_54_10]
MPELGPGGETSVPGVFVVGDLTGIPLLHLAVESGAKLIQRFADDPAFLNARAPATAEPATDVSDIVDVIIIGAGPAGVAAAIACRERGWSHVLLEATVPFNTLQNYPKGKPISSGDNGALLRTPPIIKDGTKETLLAELKSDLAARHIEVQTGASVSRIQRVGEYLEVESSRQTYRGRRVALAIGKSGNARSLGIPGEHLPKVFNRLFDPQDHAGQNVLVVGGGDSALETAIALAQVGCRVTHSYRKEGFARPKEGNQTIFSNLVKEGRIIPFWNSQIREIRTGNVVLQSSSGETVIDNDAVFAMIGRELPLAFFQRSGIRMEGERFFVWWLSLVTMISFFVMLYFGKKGNAYPVFSLAGAETLWSKFLAFLQAPFLLAHHQALFGAYGLTGYQAWFNPFHFLMGWLGAMIFIPAGCATLFVTLKRYDSLLGSTWHILKTAFLTIAATLFFWVYFHSVYGSAASWVNDPTQCYAGLYCVTMFFFGIRRCLVTPSRYVRLQVAVLCAIQVCLLYLLPFQKIGDSQVFDILIGRHFDPDGWVMRQVFPIGRWTSFWFVLFWPLSLDSFGATTFWTVFPLVQLGVLFWCIRHWGKGIYCGWICSCGGMAETFGDEYRTRSPHGPVAKKLENIGQVVLAFAILATGLHLALKKGWLVGITAAGADLTWGVYLLTIDIVFAGVLGLGVYGLLGGRVWCRYGCPLAAIMHIMTRFSRYRILAEKKKCISCGICTKVCHMGIDVMNYASKGIPMNDVECVRCSACIFHCPMHVLAFGKLDQPDPDNRSRLAIPVCGKDDWRAGLR